MTENLQPQLQTLIPPDRRVRMLLGEGRTGPGPLGWTSFLLRQPTDDGLLLYNTLTLELLHVPAPLVPALDSPDGALRETLRRKWFLVPADLDQHRTVQELRETLRILEPPKPWIQKYTVSTTTACNAGCAYCFERKWERRTMSPETADRVASYMLAHSGKHRFVVNWFGGEPLFNRGVIDRICDRLSREGADFESVFTTNAYLFDPETLQADIARWRMTRCQITLDGTEEEYNRIKNYAHAEGSPFRRVLRNIHALSAAGIGVMIRLNFDFSNFEDIRQLVLQLNREFGGEPGIQANAAMLYEYESDPSTLRTPEERERIHALREELMELLREGGLARHTRLPRELQWHLCMADSGDMITILPDGRIGLCEAYGPEQAIGHIDAPELDADRIEEFRAMHPELPCCADCPVFPLCLPLWKCPNQICHPQRRAANTERRRLEMLREWDAYKARKNSGA